MTEQPSHLQVQEGGRAGLAHVRRGVESGLVGGGQVGAVGVEPADAAARPCPLDPAGRRGHADADAVVLAHEQDRRRQALVCGPRRGVERPLRRRVIERRVAEAAQHDGVARHRLEQLEVTGQLQREGQPHRLGQVRRDGRGLRRDPQRPAADDLVAAAGDRLVSRGHHAEQDIARRVGVAGLARTRQEERAGTVVQQRRIIHPQRLGHRRVPLVTGRSDRVVASAALAHRPRLEIEVPAAHLVIEQIEQLPRAQASREWSRAIARARLQPGDILAKPAVDRLGRRPRVGSPRLP